MKKTFPFLFLLLCISTVVSAQNYEDGLDFRYDLPSLGLQRADIIIFDKKDTSAFITKCYLDTAHKQIHYFHCYGGLFATMHISPPDMQAVLEKEITPFEYFNLVTIANLHFIQNAKENLQDNGSNAKFTADEKQYLQFDDSVKYPSTLTKLLSLDKRLADIETQFIQFNSVQPKYIKRKRIYYNTFFCEYGEMIVGHVRDSIATFYNKIDAQPVYKAILDIRKATIDYYDRSNEVIDEIEINKNKVVLLATEKFDVFALYRTWLEWKRQNIVEAIEQTKKQATVPAIKKYALNELATQTKMLSDLDNKIFYLSNADIEYVRQRLRRKFGPLFAPFDPQETARMTYETVGEKTYELRDHRGNVMVVISDAKRGIPRKDDSTKVDHYEAIVVGATDYTSFGKPMEGRSFNSGDYPYGFNGKRNDAETGYQDYGMRIYDPQVARFISVDAVTKSYPELTPYQFASNSPIAGIDLDGKEFTLNNWAFNIWLDWKFGDPTGAKELIQGAVEKARVQTGDVTYHRADIPKNVQNDLDRNNTIEADTKILNGTGKVTAFTVKTSAEIASNIIPLGEGVEIAVQGAKELSRARLAVKFYEDAGFEAGKIASHVEGIDLTKAVQTTTLKKGTVIQQWVGENGVGNYFTTLENGAAKNLGIPDYEKRVLQQFTLTDDVKVLKSTAKKLNGNAGGGTQFFSPELKTKATPVTSTTATTP